MFIYRNRNRKDRKLKDGRATFGVLHETANPGATAMAHYKWITGSDQFYAHAYVDWIETLQFIPWDEYGNHAKEPANSQAIGVEMCRPKGHNSDKFAIVYRESVGLFARLFFYGYIANKGKVTKTNLMSHDEVRLKWRKTNHTDPTSLLREYGKSMDGFRLDVQEELDKLKSANPRKI
jgi:N-acetylmuramoyl-L-alanine amidase CwlA